MQIYSQLNYQTKVKPEVIRRWNIEQDLAERSDDDEQTAQARHDRAKILILVNFKMSVAGDLLKNETTEVKAYVEAKRLKQRIAIDEEEDEEERLQRLRSQARYNRSISS